MTIKKIFCLTSLCNNVLLFIIFAQFFCTSSLNASFEFKGCGARARGMGLAFAGLANSPDAVFLNCSGTKQLSSPAFSFFYTKPFGMKELAYYSFASALPFSFGNIATAVSSFGNEIYQEQSMLLNFSRSLTNNIYYGFNAHYMKLQIRGYGSDYSFGFDFGFLVRITPKLNWGFFTTNITRSTVGESDDQLPQTFVSGLSAEPINNFIVNVDLYEELPFPVELRVGTEYLIFNKIALRSGFITGTSEFCFGLGFVLNKFSCDYAVNTHPDLGLTHQFSFQIGGK